MRVAVVGVGCIGSVVAAHFARARHDVTLVARGRRRDELVAHGLVVRRHGERAAERFSLNTVGQLTVAPAELLLVCVQTQQVDALLAQLVDHPAERVCFLLNAHPIPAAWHTALGPRLILGFPAMVAGYRGHEVAYRTLPAAARFAMITTLGPAPGTDHAAARALVRTFVSVGLSATFHEDMSSWLASHCALIAPLMAFGAGQLAEGASLAMTPHDARTVAAAMHEAFALVRGLGLSLVPLNVAALAETPSLVIAAGLWSASQTPWFRRAVTDYIEHSRQEIVTMCAGLLASAGGHVAPQLALLSAQARSAPRHGERTP